MRKALALAALTLVACTNASVTPVGHHTYAALPAATPVRVFNSDKEVGRAFEVVGIVDYVNPGKYQVLSLEDAMPDVEDRARSVGGNGVIIDDSQPVKSGIVSTGIHVKARAIRIGN